MNRKQTKVLRKEALSVQHIAAQYGVNGVADELRRAFGQHKNGMITDDEYRSVIAAASYQISVYVKTVKPFPATVQQDAIADMSAATTSTRAFSRKVSPTDLDRTNKDVPASPLVTGARARKNRRIAERETAKQTRRIAERRNRYLQDRAKVADAAYIRWANLTPQERQYRQAVSRRNSRKAQ